MSPALANLLFESANFLLLAAALGWVLFKPVRRALDAEQQRHAVEQQQGERLLAEAESLAEQARRAKQEVEAELEQRRQQILSAAQREASEILEEARRTERARRQALARELEAARGAELVELAAVIGGLAADAVRKLLEAVNGPSIDLALIRGACDRLRRLPLEARRAAQVESARALDAEAKRLLQSALGGEFTERVVTALGAGVRVTTPAGQVDATALSLARHAGRIVTQTSTDSCGEQREGASDG